MTIQAQLTPEDYIRAQYFHIRSRRKKFPQFDGGRGGTRFGENFARRGRERADGTARPVPTQRKTEHQAAATFHRINIASP